MKYFDLKVGFTCNNNCVHCVITDKKGTKDLSTFEIKSIIDTIPTDTIVGFTGGEPTIRNDFIELLSYAKKTGHNTALQTNGTQFADFNFAAEASKYLDHVLIAIHSHIPEYHNAIVRVFGMYDKTIQGFKNILKLGIPCQTQTVLSKINTDDLLETYDFIQELSPGISMNMTYPHPNGNALKNSDVVVQKLSDIKPIIQKVLAKYSSFISTEAIPLCYLYPYQDEVTNFDEDLLSNSILKQGIDPANKNAINFDENGFTENYAVSQLSEKRKGPKCVECLFNNRCVGVWKEYSEIYRNSFDLFPIQESVLLQTKKIEDMNPEELIEQIKKDDIHHSEISCEDGCCDQQDNQQDEQQDNQQDEQQDEQGIAQEWGSLIISTDTGHCMNSCTFCEGGSIIVDPIEKLNKIISEANYFIENGFKMVEISGGDPGEYIGIVEIIEYLKKNGIKIIQLSTHGRTLKNENLVKDLKEAGVDLIRIPLYGSNETIHNKSAQYKSTPGNAFEDTIQGIKNCVKYGISIIGFTLFNQYNKSDINNIIQLYIDLCGDNLDRLHIGLAFISILNYTYTGDWYLPIKDMGPYVKEVHDNHPKLPEKTFFNFLDIPYCVIGEYTDKFENKFAGFPNLGKHSIENENRSEISDKIPHYRIKSYFDECEKCDLNDCCGAVPLNEIKMFGTYGLKAINEGKQPVSYQHTLATYMRNKINEAK